MVTSIRVFYMLDCCIRMTALLEYFELTLSKQHIRSKGSGCSFSVPLFNHARGLGSTFDVNQLFRLNH